MEKKIFAIFGIILVVCALYNIDNILAQKKVHAYNTSAISSYTYSHDVQNSTVIEDSLLNNNDSNITNTSNEHHQYNITESGKQFIIKYEKCELTAYSDLGGGYTIGYGHHGKDVKKGMRITHKQALKYFNEDIKKSEEYARYLIKQLPYTYKFSDGFFDGLVDLVYNCGVGAVQQSTFYNRLKKCRVNDNNMNINDYEYCISAVKTLNAPYKGHQIRRSECIQNMLAVI